MSNKIILLAAILLLGGCAAQSSSSLNSGSDAFALVIDADDAYKQEKWQQAEEGYRAVITKVPADAYAYFRLGNSLAKQYRFDDAAIAYKAALARDANKTKVYHNLAMIHLFQAESTLSVSLKSIPAGDGKAAQVKHMLWQLKKVTRVSLQDLPPLVSSR